MVLLVTAVFVPKGKGHGTITDVKVLNVLVLFLSALLPGVCGLALGLLGGRNGADP